MLFLLGILQSNEVMVSLETIVHVERYSYRQLSFFAYVLSVGGDPYCRVAVIFCIFSIDSPLKIVPWRKNAGLFKQEFSMRPPKSIIIGFFL